MRYTERFVIFYPSWFPFYVRMGRRYFCARRSGSSRTALRCRFVGRCTICRCLMDRSVSALRVAVAGIVLFFIYFVAVLLTLQEMDDIREKRSRSAFRREFLVVGERIASVVSAWLKTQAFILFLTSVVCIFGLAVIGNPYSFLFGCGIGILDALPVLGAGTVLIPWGVALLFQKAWKKAAVIFGIYVVCYFLRQISEARLMGKQVGLSPLGSLVSMYVGLKLFGLSGLILGPVGVLLIGDLVRMYEEQGS